MARLACLGTAEEDTAAPYLDEDQLPAATMRAACRRGSRDGGLGRRGERVRSGARRKRGVWLSR
jgi:hypothetical protein